MIGALCLEEVLMARLCMDSLNGSHFCKIDISHAKSDSAKYLADSTNGILITEIKSPTAHYRSPLTHLNPSSKCIEITLDCRMLTKLSTHSQLHGRHMCATFGTDKVFAPAMSRGRSAGTLNACRNSAQLNACGRLSKYGAFGQLRKNVKRVGSLTTVCRAVEAEKAESYRTIIQGRNVKLTEAIKTFAVSSVFIIHKCVLLSCNAIQHSLIYLKISWLMHLLVCSLTHSPCLISYSLRWSLHSNVHCALYVCIHSRCKIAMWPSNL